MFSEYQIKKFQTIYEKCFGKKLSKEDVYEKGAKLVRLVELVYQPMAESDLQKLQDRRQKINNLKK